MNAMAPRPIPRGVHAILYAFFDGDERLDRAAMRAQTQACLKAGVAGIAALGLATEVGKLTPTERRTIMDWVAEDVAGCAPLGFTIFGASVAEQVEGVRAAESCGADWVILQPPMAGSFAPAEYIRFFGRVADATHRPVAIQNAPAYLGRCLTAAGLRKLTRQHANVALLKGEGSAIEIAEVIEATEGMLTVFNGRGGLEIVDNLRAGCAGFLLAPDNADHAAAVQAAFEAGDEAGAEARYASILPAIVTVMGSIETFVGYGKRLFALRCGRGAVRDRAPALRPTPFGLAAVERFARAIGPFGRKA